MLGVPVMSGGLAVGSIRVYTKERHEFTNQDISFVVTMANLASVALSQSLQHQEKEARYSAVTSSAVGDLC